MSETLQNDEYVEELDSDDTEVEEVNESQPEDLATDSDGEHEEKPDDSEQKQVNQNAVNEAINRQHRKYQEEKRKNDELEQRLSQLQPKEQAPEILSRPDPFDDDYDTKLTAYEQSIRQSAQYEYAQQQQQQILQQQRAYQQQKMQADLTTKAATYAEKAKGYGINPQELQQAGQLVASMGLSEDVAMFILEDEQGPLITRHLAINHVDAEAIIGMAPLQAAMYIERTIKPKTAALKKKQTNAPAPATKIQGRGGDKDTGKYRFSSGANFE